MQRYSAIATAAAGTNAGATAIAPGSGHADPGGGGLVLHRTQDIRFRLRQVI